LVYQQRPDQLGIATIPTALHHVYDEVGSNAKIIATTASSP